MKPQFSGIPSDYIPLKGDASSRAYYRGSGHILVKYPADGAESFENYLFWTKRYGEAGIPVPLILEADCQKLEMSLEDWGDTDGVTWFNKLKTKVERQSFVQSVYHFIPLIQSLDKLENERVGRRIDLAAELSFFMKHAGDTIFKGQNINWLNTLCDEIVRVLDGGKWRLAHRDYHFRNILVQNGKICVIDFQDTMFAPEFYDSVSLIFDNYLDLTEIASEIEPEVDNPIFRWVALQRNLKALGTFAWFGYKRKKLWFRDSVPLAMGHVASHLDILGLEVAAELWKKLVESVISSGQ